MRKIARIVKDAWDKVRGLFEKEPRHSIETLKQDLRGMELTAMMIAMAAKGMPFEQTAFEEAASGMLKKTCELLTGFHMEQVLAPEKNTQELINITTEFLENKVRDFLGEGSISSLLEEGRHPETGQWCGVVVFTHVPLDDVANVRVFRYVTKEKFEPIVKEHKRISAAADHQATIDLLNSMESEV